MSAYVYLLWHKTEPRFKIGKADNLRTRIQQLGISQFDLARTKLLELDDCSQAVNLERVLHRMFQRHRLMPGQAAPVSCPELRSKRHDGDTEWFSAECWGRLHNFVEQNEDLLECSWVTAEEVCEHVQPLGDVRNPKEYREQHADVRVLYGSILSKPVEEPATKAAVRWNRLHRFGMIPKLELKRKNNVMDTVSRIHEAFETLARTCSFIAVVQTPEGYKLVGEAPMGSKSLLTLTLEKLKPMLSGRYSASRTWTRHFFALDLAGAPGQEPETATCYESWCERLAWSQTPAVPGFDVPLRLTEVQRATEILRDVFGVAMNDTNWKLPLLA